MLTKRVVPRPSVPRNGPPPHAPPATPAPNAKPMGGKGVGQWAAARLGQTAKPEPSKANAEAEDPVDCPHCGGTFDANEAKAAKKNATPAAKPLHGNTREWNSHPGGETPPPAPPGPRR